MSQVAPIVATASTVRLGLAKQPVGTITLIPITGSPTISNIVLDKNGIAWFTCEGGTNRIGVYDYTTNQVRLYVLGNPGDNFGGIWTGPDSSGVPNNAIWIGNSIQNTVQIISLATAQQANGANAIVQATLACTAQPGGLALGADGAMWCCYGTANAVARLAYTGTWSETLYTDLSATATHGNHLGWDGRMWACEGTPSKLVAYTTAGVPLEYPCGAGANPYWVQVGPNDGFMYYSGLNGNRLGRMRTDGSALQEWTCPNLSSAPGGIWPGPYGKVWFCEKVVNGGGNRIGVLDPSIAGSAAITEYSTGLPAGADPDKITYHWPTGLMIGTLRLAGQLFTIQP